MPNSKSAPKKPPLTDADRHKRFKDMAKELDADESADTFEKAFTKIVSAPVSNS